MTHYIFPPAPSKGYGDHSFTTWRDGFSDSEIEQIIEMGESGIKNPATIGKGQIDDNYRSTDVSWIHYDQSSDWLYNRLRYIIQNLNGQYYGFDIHGLCESLQFSVYNSDKDGHYDWHQDAGSNTETPRKLSIVIQLSDPDKYEGGNLEILSSREPVVVEKQKGLAVLFPSYVLHRVTPVTRGVRKTLVAWITGPKFR
jgi:PKHD-type hydroxylase